MSLVRPIRKSRLGFFSYRVIIVSVVVLCGLMARYAPPRFAGTTGHSSVRSHPSLSHRQCFDHENSDWMAPPSAMSAIPCWDESHHAIRRAESFVENVKDGWHYNRPPPIG